MNAVLDSVFCASANVAATCGPYEKLGFRLDALAHDHRVLSLGSGTKRFQVHYLSGAGRFPPLHPAVVRARLQNTAHFAIGLRVSDLAGEISRLMGLGVPVVFSNHSVLLSAWLPIRDQAGCDVVLLAESVGVAGAHTFPVSRLDHLAVIAHDLDAKSRYWRDMFGLEPIGEVVTPTLIIRQYRLGDAILELLGPASADSPLHQRPAGLLSMASWEVASLAEAVKTARERGFTPSEPGEGPLPGTKISTIPGSELSGVNMQLLEYVR
jgi:catechol 2,3-dioxygenase-like lactoylglutathione lyase family enzyme